MIDAPIIAPKNSLCSLCENARTKERVSEQSTHHQKENTFMKVIHGSLPQDSDPANFKTCPVCGSVCFADMDTCFGCLHHFTDADATKTTPIPIVRNNERIITPSTARTAQPPTNIEHPRMKERARIKISPTTKNSDLQTEPAESGNGNGGAITHRVCAETAGSAFEIALTIEIRPIV